MSKKERNWKRFSRTHPTRGFPWNYFNTNIGRPGDYFNRCTERFRYTDSKTHASREAKNEFKNSGLHFDKVRNEGVKSNHELSNSFCSGTKNKKEIFNGSRTEVPPWSEEAKEEERKRQLTCTATVLMKKIKMWNAQESKEQKEGNGNTNNVLQKLIDMSSDKNDKEFENNKSISESSGCKSSFIANGKKVKELKKKSYFLGCNAGKKQTNIRLQNKNNVCQPKSSQTIDENKQKKIQQNVIGKLMTMPKQSLRKVLIDPKLNPKVESGVAMIVKENRLILAQKFRALAESKMSGQGRLACSKFVNDIGNLIDSDLAVDVWQLPPEMIKQMSDIFQLDFGDYANLDEHESDGANVDILADRSEAEIDNYDNSSGNVLCKDSLELSDELNSENSEKFQLKLEPKDEGSNSPTETLVESDSIELINTSHNNFTHKHNEKLTDPSSSIILDERKSTVKQEIADDGSEDINSTTSSGGGNKAVTHFDENSRSELLSPENVFSSSTKNLLINVKSENELCGRDDYNSNIYGVSDSITGRDANFDLNVSDGNDRNIKQENNAVDENQYEQVQWMVPEEEHDELSAFNTFASIKKENFEYPPTEKPSSLSRNLENQTINSVEVQTDITLLEVQNSLLQYEEPLNENAKESLIREVHMIDNLVHHLNQRRFLLFLRLAGIKSFNVDNS